MRSSQAEARLSTRHLASLHLWLIWFDIDNICKPLTSASGTSEDYFAGIHLNSGSCKLHYRMP